MTCGLLLERQLICAKEVGKFRKFANLPRPINHRYLLTQATELQAHRRS